MSLLTLVRSFGLYRIYLNRATHGDLSITRRWFSDASETGDDRQVQIPLADKTLTISPGNYARFANGTAICSLGDTSVMVTAVSKPKPGSSIFMPLTVEYRQKSAAAGRIPTNFLRRELGPSEREILTARVIDRSLRPLFPSEYRCDTQLVCNLLAIDSQNFPDVLSINAASLALALSDIPWNGPVAAVRVGLDKQDVLVNPTRKEVSSSALDLIITATKDNLVVMLEGKGNVVPICDLMHAIKTGVTECKKIISGIEKLQSQFGKEKQAVEPVGSVDENIIDTVRVLSEMRLREVFRDYSHDKMSRDRAVTQIREEVLSTVASANPDTHASIILDQFNQISKKVFREIIFDNERCDGRSHEQLRDISCDVNLYKPLHGSALFQRGQTQVLSTVSLDSIDSALKLDTLSSIDLGVKSKNFFLHYEFPPYATGEVGRIGHIGRREIGHGALAEKALLPIIPNDHPFTIRLTAEVLESNGSSSMATVCGGTMALMDAGVPITAPAAGVAIGLVTKYAESDPTKLEDYRLLTDILGIEDYLGDMDMKIAGTKKGITAIQADIKTSGITLQIIDEALKKSHVARSTIIDIMSKCIAKPRTEKKECWPVTEKLTIEPYQRSRLIGPGGINVKKIFLTTGVHLTQEDEWTFTIFAPSVSAMEEAKEHIDTLLIEVKAPELDFGAIYTAKIVEMKDTGVMVTFYPGMQPALLHVSQLDHRRVANPEALGLQVGQEIQVKYFGRDPVSGFMRLSRKVLQMTSSGVVHNLDKTI